MGRGSTTVNVDMGAAILLITEPDAQWKLIPNFTHGAANPIQSSFPITLTTSIAVASLVRAGGNGA